MICDYCQGPTELVGGVVIYPHLPELADRQFYYCRPCVAWVGCHQGSTSPMGRLANKELRDAKMRAHAAFDPAWRGRVSRGFAYRWLAKELGLDRRKAHIGMFDVEQCERVIQLAPSLRSLAEAEQAHETARLKPMMDRLDEWDKKLIESGAVRFIEF